jgi:uncharacterized protein (TIGR03382 family)
MKIRRPLHAAPFTVAAILIMMLAATASASTIKYDTNDEASLEGFNGINVLVLNSTGGADTATITYVPQPDTTVGEPTYINLGNFVVSCPSCGTQASGNGATFGAFNFELYVVLDTPGDHTAVGEFTGKSTGGTVYSDNSTVSLIWQTPTQAGSGTTNAYSGNFGNYYFQVFNPTPLVAPNSGNPLGTTTVQGYVGDINAPEPATMAMAGGLLIGLAGLARRRRRA